MYHMFGINLLNKCIINKIFLEKWGHLNPPPPPPKKNSITITETLKQTLELNLKPFSKNPHPCEKLSIPPEKISTPYPLKHFSTLPENFLTPPENFLAPPENFITTLKICQTH